VRAGTTRDEGTGNAPAVLILVGMGLAAVFFGARAGTESGLKREPNDVDTERVPNDGDAGSMLSDVRQTGHSCVRPWGAYLTGKGAGASATENLPAVGASVGIGFAVGVGAGHALRNAPKDMNDGASDSVPNDGDMTSAEKATGGGSGVAMTLRASPSAGGAGNAVSSEPNERDADIENDEEAEAIMLEMSGVGEGVRVRLKERTQGATAGSSSDRRGKQ
jgi:hypothetical protein